MATGRVLQFDHTRGYGFVATDDGGEDVFLHASVFDGDAEELVPGTMVEFKIMAGDRGRKAFAAHLGADDDDTTAPRPVLATVPTQTGPTQPVPAPPAPPSPSAARSYRISTHDDEPDTDDELRDTLSPNEFSLELTELLLSDVPALTAQQILQVRHSVLEWARKHGWVDI